MQMMCKYIRLCEKSFSSCFYFAAAHTFYFLNLLKNDTIYLLKPDRVFDGEQMHEGWQVLVKNNKIEDAGNISTKYKDAIVIDLKGCTLLPGLIEGHSHMFLHPYNETSWNDQVLKESDAERVARATVHARKYFVCRLYNRKRFGN